MLRGIELTNFKAFERFRVDLRSDDAYLVGPNNAGKSTILAATRAAAYMVRIATRRKPSDRITVDGVPRFGHHFSARQVRLIDENLRHEFRRQETRLTVRFSSKAAIEAIWPIEDGGDEASGFFFVRYEDVAVRGLREVRGMLPSIGVVPVLSPLEHTERLLSDDYVRDNLDGRLASRHTRNQLRLLQHELSSDTRFETRLEEFLHFAEPWLPDVSVSEVSVQYGDDTSVDVYYEEASSRVPKEIFWTGDGVQIWLQLLLHLFRLRDREVIVLDEPDVFLHADLQRRMVDLLDSLPAQTITATHSAEVLGEARDECVLWVSKNRRRSVRTPRPKVLYELASTLGTQFNLRLARALRARTVLFVEGHDAKLLRELARTLDLERLVRERDLAVIPMLGFDRWEHLEPFQWLVSELLEDAIQAYVVLDRDYRRDSEVDQVQNKLLELSIRSHVWQRKEIENYLLVPPAIARLSGASPEWVESSLQAAADSLEDEVWGQIHAAYEKELLSQGFSKPTIATRAKQAADAAWADRSRRANLCGGKELLRLLNARLQAERYQSVTDRQLARSLHVSEIDVEIADTLREIQDA